MAFWGRKRPPAPINAAGVMRAEWVMPVGAGPDPSAALLTSIGTVDSAWPVTVDPRGLVSVPLAHPGLRPWSLDWWVGADDRWHLPSKDTGVRQHLVDGAPVVETRMRIPSGDVVHRVFGVRGPTYPAGEGDAYGDEYVVVEVQNESTVPFVLAMVIRPFGPDGTPAMMNGIGLVPVAGGAGVDVAQAVVIDGRAVALLPRKPSRASGSADGSDVAEDVTTGAAPDELEDFGKGAQPTLAVLFPVPHTATFRMVLPLGVAANVDPPFPSPLPPVDRVAAGWAIQTRRGARVDVPDTGMAEGVGVARATLLLAARVDRGIDPEVVVGLDREGFHDEAAEHLARWPELLLATALDPTASRAALRAIIEHWRLTHDRPAVEALLPEISALASSLPRAVPRQAPPELRVRQAAALRGLAELLAGLDQPAAAEAARTEADGLAPIGTTVELGGEPSGRAKPANSAGAASLDPIPEPEAWRRVRRLVSAASATWAWPGGPAASAAFLAAVRAVLVAEEDDGLAVMPAGFGPWWGQGVELHDGPTRFGRLSFAIRWHGERPALLWDFVGHDGAAPVTLSAPAIDPAWSSIEPKGETLLAAVPRPLGWVDPRPSVVPDGMGQAESVAPRSVLPLIPSGSAPTPEAADDSGPPVGETSAPVDPPDPSGASFS